MSDYPQIIAPVDHVEPAPRRIRAFCGGAVVLDTTRAMYVWEWPNYPQYSIPIADVDQTRLVDEATSEQCSRGVTRRFGLRVKACPYKGMTSAYWSIRVGGAAYPDPAWAYDFPRRQLLAMAGLVAFSNEKVDILIDGQRAVQPTTHFFKD